MSIIILKLCQTVPVRSMGSISIHIIKQWCSSRNNVLNMVYGTVILDLIINFGRVIYWVLESDCFYWPFLKFLNGLWASFALKPVNPEHCHNILKYDNLETYFTNQNCIIWTYLKFYLPRPEATNIIL